MLTGILIALAFAAGCLVGQQVTMRWVGKRRAIIVEKCDLRMALKYILEDDNGWNSLTTPEWFVQLARAEAELEKATA